MEKPFSLSADPPPKPRTLRGQRERKTLRFQRSRKAYISACAIKRAILYTGRLPKSRHEEIGVSSLFSLLLRWRDDIRALLDLYKEKSIRALFKNHYGRTPPYFQFHHVKAPKDFDMENEEERNRCCHFSNIRLVTAEENLTLASESSRGNGHSAPTEFLPSLQDDSRQDDY
jgi:hypothetical protein